MLEAHKERKENNSLRAVEVKKKNTIFFFRRGSFLPFAWHAITFRGMDLNSNLNAATGYEAKVLYTAVVDQSFRLARPRPNFGPIILVSV